MQTKVTNGNEIRMLNLTELSDYVGLGRNRAKTYADQIGATRHIGRRLLYDKRVIDKALDEMQVG